MKPRCGFKSKERTGDDVMKYIILDKWNKNKLTWKITKYPLNILRETECKKTRVKALELWQDNADLEFLGRHRQM